MEAMAWVAGHLRNNLAMVEREIKTARTRDPAHDSYVLSPRDNFQVLPPRRIKRRKHTHVVLVDCIDKMKLPLGYIFHTPRESHPFSNVRLSCSISLQTRVLSVEKYRHDLTWSYRRRYHHSRASQGVPTPTGRSRAVPVEKPRD